MIIRPRSIASVVPKVVLTLLRRPRQETDEMRIAITGEESFARRHKLFFDAVAERCTHVDYVTSNVRTPQQRRELIASEVAFATKHVLSARSRIPLAISDLRRLRRDYLRSPESFKIKSIQTQRNLMSLENPPDAVLHIFGMYRPYWTHMDVPFFHYLDYTAALQHRSWQSEGSRSSNEHFKLWRAFEQETYFRANHLFAMSKLVERSLIEDYEVHPGKITVVGSGGHYVRRLAGQKPFGSKQILFNANPFARKGGDIALAAFEIVRRKVPNSSLVVIGTSVGKAPPGVINTGFVSSPDTMQRLFEQSDVVIAPARQDPFPGFLIEAMSHGVPCIASAVDGMPEIVDHGVNGTIVATPSPEVLANEIVGLLQDAARLRAYSDASVQKAREHFDWAKIASKTFSRMAPVGQCPQR